MNSYTSTPWVYDPRYPDKFYSDDATGSVVGECPKYSLVRRSDAEREANARRIVASVNACATVLDVEDLESGRFVFGNYRDFAATQKECDDAKTQRDELLAAAEKALAECVDLISTPAGDALQSAITKAKGDAA